MDRAAPGKGLPAAARSDVQGSPRESLWERARPALPHTASKALESHGESSLGSLVTPGVRRMFGLEHRFLFLRGGFLRVQLPKNSLTIHPPPHCVWRPMPCMRAPPGGPFASALATPRFPFISGGLGGGCSVRLAPEAGA